MITGNVGRDEKGEEPVLESVLVQSFFLLSKLHIGHTEQCLAVPRVRQQNIYCSPAPIYEPLKKGIWPDHTPVARKLYGSMGDLRCTATFIEETGVSI